jgi:hypothetical protein
VQTKQAQTNMNNVDEYKNCQSMATAAGKWEKK